MIVKYELIRPNEPDPQTGEWAPHTRPVTGQSVVDIDIEMRECPICGVKKPFWRIKAKRPLLKEELPLVVEVDLYTSPRGRFWWKGAHSPGLLSQDYYAKDIGQVLYYFPIRCETPEVVYVPRYTPQEFFPATALVVWENDFSGCLIGDPEEFPEEWIRHKTRPHVGCIIKQLIEGREPVALQGRLEIYQLSPEDERVLPFLYHSPRLFNHWWSGEEEPPPIEELILRKVGDARYGIAIIRREEPFLLRSTEHAPLQLSEGRYLLLHPVPSRDGAD